MKNKLIILAGFILGFNSIALSQSKDLEYSNVLNHEVKIDGLYLLLGNIEASYESLLSNESSVGLSLMIPFDNYVDWKIKFAATGYYRFHFGDKYANGFFLEGFTMLNKVEDRVKRTGTFGDSFKKDKEITDLALGLGAGYKLISSSGVILEFHAGVGRNLFSSDNDDRNFNYIFRGGVNVGYRF
ncbi:DUF3575 domain-containing protein [Psychroflexus maritimus]|uniref:DUF3575 domain-containing protein n=1 Tax=Psychroflexus maritimus TaxID=2714865 RepID=A0A967DYY0_9FLAO|nr:DUF3575 domain-containing protein [Psychroflexus maritimus]NGZ90305.1 DUF3575 domain-containing protein [Psychroflexus maritimus]